MYCPGMNKQRMIKSQAAHAYGGIGGYRQLELFCIGVVVRIDIEGDAGVVLACHLVLAHHQIAGFSSAEPMDAAYIIAGYISAQSTKISAAIHGVAAGVAIVIMGVAGAWRLQSDDGGMDENGDCFAQMHRLLHQAEWVSFADLQWTDT